MSEKMTSGRIPIPGSEPPLREGTAVIGPADPAEVAVVSVVLRAPSTGPVGVNPSALSLEEKRERFAARAQDVQAVVDFAAEQGLEVVDARAETRAVRLRGTLAALGAAFGVGFERRAHPTGDHRGQVGPVTLPAHLADRVLGVLGLDGRRLMFGGGAGDAFEGPTGPIAPVDLVDLPTYFDLPGTDGTGQYIGILDFGGPLGPTQTTTWFQENHLPVPNISQVIVGTGPSGPTAPPTESWLDVAMTGFLAPGATIVAYFAEWGASGVYAAAMEALTDGASVISVSYGAPEQCWCASERASVDSALEAAQGYGATVCIASGDSGATFVSYPAVSPWVLACGGTQPVSGGTQAVWWQEVPTRLWSSGGGVSQLYPVPAFQSDNGVVPVPVIIGSACSPPPPGPTGGRGIPDVAGFATGIKGPTGGPGPGFGGTSASAPFWASVVARLNQALGYNLGYLNPTFYGWGPTSSAFTDITAGNNIPPGGTGYYATVGWDACTGLGTPLGNPMLAMLQSASGPAAP